MGGGWLGWVRSAVVGLGGGAGVSPDDAEAAGSVEVDGGDAQVEPQVRFGEAGDCQDFCVSGVI